MKKSLSLFFVLACFTQSSMAASEISTLNTLAQTQFRALSEDLAAALSYKPVTPAEPLGITGFDIGLEVTSTKVENSQIWSQATNNGEAISNLYVPKLHIAKGLPLNFDIAAFYSKIPSSNIKLVGAELRYALLAGGVAMPAIAIRGAYTKLSGVNQLDFGTKSLDISISKGIAMFTPYLGAGKVWIDSKPNAGTLIEEKFTKNKTFVGVNMNFGVTNLALEADKTGLNKSYSLKLGFRF